MVNNGINCSVRDFINPKLELNNKPKENEEISFSKKLMKKETIIINK